MEPTPLEPQDGSSIVRTTAVTPVDPPDAAELAVTRADLEIELSNIASAKRRYRWFAGISVTYAPIFFRLGLSHVRASGATAAVGHTAFFLMALVGLLSVVSGTALYFREHARWKSLRADLLSIEFLSSQLPTSEPQEPRDLGCS